MRDSRHASTDLARRRLAGAGALAWLALVAGCGGGNTEKVEAAVLPTLQIASDVPGTATGVFNLRFTFSAPVTDFLANRILITNGALAGATLVQVSDTVYTLAVTPAVNLQGIVNVQVLPGAFKDSTGTVSSTLTYVFGQSVDTVVVNNEPTLTITNSTTNGVLTTSSVTFTFTFSTDVGTSFNADAILLNVGTITAFTRVSGTVCTAVVTVPAGSSGLLLLEIRPGAFASTAGFASQQDYKAGLLLAVPA